ncbi:MAG: PrsW family intramembrane metalloprotease [Candidatus Omnitrophica bacterium]|nr:PrsW family intramembrane metalloprotease [Candidatus Omnitrophota bacterium]
MTLPTIFSFLMAIIPSIFFVYYFYRQYDKPNLEPKGLIAKVFLLGIIYTFPVYIIEQGVGLINSFYNISPFIYYFFESFVVAGLCEEYIKLRIVRKYVYQNKHFDSIMDGIIYTITASLGFACMENIIYVMNGTFITALARGVTAVPMHAISSGIMGYFIGKAKFSGSGEEERRLMNKGLWSAVLVHGSYDLLLFVSPIPGAIFSIIFALFFVWSYFLLKEKINLAKSEDKSILKKSQDRQSS